MKPTESPAEAIAGSAARRKLGLALSGGGFRAALFHLGVLARLAEEGLLRRVEVISTVSGGSTIGALYYIHVKLLLERVPDADVADSDYIEIVERLVDVFPKAVARNLRGRAFLNPWSNLKMALPSYSRTDRIGELYERWLYRPALGVDGPVPMTSLLVHPAGHEGPFDPDEQNADRLAPVPILLLNAATLNTGHNWRFEAMYLGEPDLSNAAVDEVDKNARLARTKYELLTGQMRDFNLGRAVAASAAFPGLVRPLEIRNLYERQSGKKTVPLTIELMDGGAHDNQGVESLINRGCTHLVVSDAGGPMPDKDSPGARIPAVIRRAYDIASDRMREQQLMEALRLRSTAFVHLQKGLPAVVLSPRGAGGKTVSLSETEAPPGPPTTEFGVHPDVQQRLAFMRTDLDAFSEVEARSLMWDGYRMLGTELEDAEGVRALSNGNARPEQDWSFASIGPWLARPTDGYLGQLSAAKQQFFKPFLLSRPLGIAGAAAGLAALGAIVWGLVMLYPQGEAVQPFWIVIGVLAAVLLVVLYLRPEMPLVGRLSEPVYGSLLPALLALILPVFALLMLGGGRVFCWLGRQERLGRPPL